MSQWYQHRRSHSPSWKLPATADAFGFLNRRISVKLSFAEIRPVPDFDAAQKWVTVHTNPDDGFLHPPLESLYQPDPLTHRVRRVKGSQRPAGLHRLPASHILELHLAPVALAERERVSIFLMHLFGYVNGAWLQFHDWWFSSAVRMDGGNSPFIAPPPVVEEFMEIASHEWVNQQPENQVRIARLLFMYCRVPNYRSFWERFAWEYAVTDSIWKASGLKSNGHRRRITDLCTHYGVPFDPALVQRIVDWRNDLIHEVSWDGNPPTGASSHDAVHATLDLHKLNSRLIPALLGYRTPYIGTKWWGSRTKFAFLPPA